MVERKNSTDEPDLGADREPPATSFFGSYLGAGIAGFLGSLVSAILFFGYVFYNTNNPSVASELVICTGVCLSTSLIVGPILGVIGGRMGSYITKNSENTATRTVGWLIGGFIAGMLYIPITLLLFELANQSFQSTSG